jgi:hypothetical protein
LILWLLICKCVDENFDYETTLLYVPFLNLKQKAHRSDAARHSLTGGSAEDDPAYQITATSDDDDDDDEDDDDEDGDGASATRCKFCVCYVQQSALLRCGVPYCDTASHLHEAPPRRARWDDEDMGLTARGGTPHCRCTTDTSATIMA